MSKDLGHGWTKIEDRMDIELLTHPPMDEFESQLWRAIVAASQAGDTSKMLKLVSMFDRYQVGAEMDRELEIIAFDHMRTNHDLFGCQLTHFGLAL